MTTNAKEKYQALFDSLKIIKNKRNEVSNLTIMIGNLKMSELLVISVLTKTGIITKPSKHSRKWVFNDSKIDWECIEKNYDGVHRSYAEQQRKYRDEKKLSHIKESPVQLDKEFLIQREQFDESIHAQMQAVLWKLDEIKEVMKRNGFV